MSLAKLNPIVVILMQRDDFPLRDALEALEDARMEVFEHGRDPAEVLLEELGLEPDYIFDLIGD